MNIAVNGCGRIGKSFIRALFSRNLHKELSIITINSGPADPQALAYGLKYDSIFGTFSGSIEFNNGILTIDNCPIKIISELDATKLPWQEQNIDWVVDVTGKFTHAQDARKHIDSGAQKVLISAPAHDEDVAIVLGVNDHLFDAKKHNIVSIGSCTTNALLPLLKIIHDTYGILHAQALTTHAYTNSQKLLDVDAQSKDPRKSRAAALNIIPASTGASDMVAKIIPELKNKVMAHAVRVPIGNASFLQLTCLVKNSAKVDDIHAAIAQYQNTKKYVALEYEPLVSSDFIGNPHSVIVDAALTTVNGPLITVSGWYDNEWGHSNRLIDFLLTTKA